MRTYRSSQRNKPRTLIDRTFETDHSSGRPKALQLVNGKFVMIFHTRRSVKYADGAFRVHASIIQSYYLFPLENTTIGGRGRHATSDIALCPTKRGVKYPDAARVLT
jgi:hypothetical protein